MRKVSTAAGRSRARDELGRFVSQSNPRARSQPIEDRSEEDSESQIRGLQEEARVDGAEEGSDVEAADPQHQKVKESENYRIAFEDEETVRWGDAEDEAEEPLGWDFSNLRRRSSVLSGALQAVRDRSNNQDSREGESLWRPRLNLSSHLSLRGRKKRT